MHPAQSTFDQKYVSSRELTQRLQVSRPTISQARKRGILPEPIVINDTVVFLWERDVVEPFIKAWEIVLNAKRTLKSAK